jgi:hypothetical protein
MEDKILPLRYIFTSHKHHISGTVLLRNTRLKFHLTIYHIKTAMGWFSDGWSIQAASSSNPWLQLTTFSTQTLIRPSPCSSSNKQTTSPSCPMSSLPVRPPTTPPTSTRSTVRPMVRNICPPTLPYPDLHPGYSRLGVQRTRRA